MVKLLEKAKSLYWNDDFSGALKLLQEAISNAKKRNDNDLLVQCLILQMQSHMSLGNAAKAKSLSSKILKLAPAKCSEETHANSLIECGYLYYQYLEYKKSEEYTVEALIIARDNGLTSLEADALVQLAELDKCRRNYKEACVFIREALKIANHLDKKDALVDTLILKGKLYSVMGEYAEALDVFEEIDEPCRKIKRHDLLVESFLYQGDVFRAIGDFDKAERLYNEALDLSDKHNVPTKTPQILKRVGALLLHRRNYDKALEWYRFADKQVKKYKSQKYFPFIYLGQGTAFNGLGEYNRAIQYFWKVLDIMAPDYFLHSDILPLVLEQFGLSLKYLHNEKQGQKLIDMGRTIAQLSQTGIDASHQADTMAKNMQVELSKYLELIKKKKITTFSRKGVRVDLLSGDIYADGKRPVSSLSSIQLEIFKCLVENQGHPKGNQELIGLYQERVGELEGIPRRAHYYIAEIRKKLPAKDIIRTVKGSGYMIPRD